MNDDRPGVLFVCVHNAGRSQMAAGWLQALAGDRIEVFSAGSAPATSPNPAAVEAMAEVGIDIAAAQPRHWTTEMLSSVDVVVTMGCGDACPRVPDTTYLDWPLRDPAEQSPEVVREIRDEIRDRVHSLIAELTGA